MTKRILAISLLMMNTVAIWAANPQSQQQEPRPQTPQTVEEDPGAFRIGVAVDQVFLSVTARSFGGGFHKGLAKEDFIVLEDGVEQEIVNFTEEAVPVKVVLLVDVSGSTRASQVAIRKAALKFAESLGSEDQVAIITFNDKPVLILNWTNDRERIDEALGSIYAKGATVLNDALYVTFDDLLADVDGKKAIILLSDGVDSGSSVSFREALDLAVRSEAIVYVASKIDEYWAQAQEVRAYAASKSIPVPRPYQDDYIVQAKRALDQLADMTGGRVMTAEAYNSLSDAYASVAEELKNQYYLSYLPSNSRKDGTYRSIEIRTRPGVEARTRPGYYAPSGSSPPPE